MENKLKGFLRNALLVLPVSGSAAAYYDDETNFFVLARVLTRLFH